MQRNTLGFSALFGIPNGYIGVVIRTSTTVETYWNQREADRRVTRCTNNNGSAGRNKPIGAALLQCVSFPHIKLFIFTQLLRQYTQCRS